ncbi:unnamed protein product, partial [Symbiodinium sp. KB8]
AMPIPRAAAPAGYRYEVPSSSGSLPPFPPWVLEGRAPPAGAQTPAQAAAKASSAPAAKSSMVRPETALPPRTQPETKPPAPRPGENFTDLLRHRAEAVRAVHRSQHWQQYQLQQQRDIELAHAQTEEERRRAEMALQIAVLLSDKVVQASDQHAGRAAAADRKQMNMV